MHSRRFLLQALVAANPAAVVTPSAFGQLPLHMAISAGWNDHLQVLLEHHPDTLEAVSGNGWLPYQLAAISPAATLDTVYHLLRRQPSVLPLHPKAPMDCAATRATRLEEMKEVVADDDDHTCTTATQHDDKTIEEDTTTIVSKDLMRLLFRVGQAECPRLWKSLQNLLTEPTNVHGEQQPQQLAADILNGMHD